MTPFNLEAALKGAKVVTRAGRPAHLMSREPGLDSRLIWTDNTLVRRAALRAGALPRVVRAEGLEDAGLLDGDADSAGRVLSALGGAIAGRRHDVGAE